VVTVAIPKKLCRCTPAQIQRYRQRLSGPLLNRIDCHIEILRPQILAEQQNENPTLKKERSETIAKRVLITRERQMNRSGKINAYLNVNELANVAHLTSTQKKWIENISEKCHLSLRSYHRILKVARTIADMEEKENISDEHLKEALSFHAFRELCFEPLLEVLYPFIRFEFGEPTRKD